MKKWTEGNIRGDPNSTDIHAVIKTDQIAKYMVKYMLKSQPDRRLITGNLWYCSPGLSNIKISLNEHDDDFTDCCELLTKQSEVKPLEHSTLMLHRPLNKIKLHKLLRDKLTESYRQIRHKINPQTYFQVE